MLDSDSDEEEYIYPSEYPDLLVTPATKRCNKVVDPGDASACVHMKNVARTCMKMFEESSKEATWAKATAEVIDNDRWKEGPEGWCGFDSAKEAEPIKTDVKYLPNLLGLARATLCEVCEAEIAKIKFCCKVLCDHCVNKETSKCKVCSKEAKKEKLSKSRPGMLRPAWSQREWQDYYRSKGCSADAFHRAYVRFFQVAKEEGPPPVDRGIGDARNLNKTMKKSFSMHLISLLEIFETFRMFPDGFFYGGDLFSWFNELSVPDSVRSLLTICIEKKRGKFIMFEYLTWVMGLKSSPAVANSITCTWLMDAVLRAGLEVDDYGGSVAPRRILIRQNGRVVGAAIQWLDNYVIIMKSKYLRDRVKEKMLEMQKETEWNLKIKENSEFEGQLSTGLDFVGLSWKTQKGVVMYRHLLSNLRDWKKKEKIRPGNMKKKLLANYIGTLVWDFTVRRAASGDTLKLGTIAELLEILAEISKSCKIKSDWNKGFEVSARTAEVINKLFIELTQGLEEEEIFQESRSKPPTPDKKRFSASDSSNPRGAWVKLAEDGMTINYASIEYKGFISTTFKNLADEHINVKETEMAVQYLEQLEREEYVDFIHAVDNTTARSALRLGRYPGIQKLTDRILKVHERILSWNSTLSIVLVPSEDMVADDPSRVILTGPGKGEHIPPSVERGRKTLRYLRVEPNKKKAVREE